MKRIEFYNTNRSNNLLHIETEGCIINIRVNLQNDEGHSVTHVEILKDDSWQLEGTINNRLIKKVKKEE